MLALTRATALSLVALVSFAAAPVADQRGQLDRLPLTLQAQGQNLNRDIGFPQQAPIEISITRWSTDGEREQLLTVLRENGTKGLLEMMQTVPRIGSIRIQGDLNYHFHFAMRGQTPDGGAQITMIADRPVGFAEAVEGPRTLEYRFMVLQLNLNAIGRGDGRLSVVTRLSWDRITKDIQIETWENLFVTLRDVRVK